MDAAAIQEQLMAHRDVLDRYAVSALWVFGSVGRSEPDAHDIDLLVEFSETPTLVEFIQLKECLSSVFGMPVDLISKKGCSHRFLRAIEGDLCHVA